MMNRTQRRHTDKHKNHLYDLLAGFYGFMAKQPQPSDTEIIQEHKKYQHSWIMYCNKHNLNDGVKTLFAKEIAQTVCKKQEQSKKRSEEA